MFYAVTLADDECDACQRVAESTRAELDRILASSPQITEAIHFGWHRCVALLIERGVDVNVPDRWGITPLLHAIRYVDVEATRLLLARGNATIQLRVRFCGNLPCYGGVLEGWHNTTALEVLRDLIEYQQFFIVPAGCREIEVENAQKLWALLRKFRPRQELESLALCYARWAEKPDAAPPVVPLVVLRTIFLFLPFA